MMFSMPPTPEPNIQQYDWYKHLTTVNGAAIVAVGAFLQFGGDDISNVGVYRLAYIAIFLFFVSIGASVVGMYRAMFKGGVPSWFFVVFPTFFGGVVVFFIAVCIHWFLTGL
jgi:hypothetical protein